jgi:Ser/Thr protein kinase RdoA (MazF antagonist)
MDFLEEVFAAYGLNDVPHRAEPIGSGLIHRTWKVTAGKQEYILQSVNDSVFKTPEDISWNIKEIGSYLQLHHPDYLFVEPITAPNRETLIKISGEGVFRLFPFVKNSRTLDVVQTPEQAYEAALQFGRLTKNLAGFDCLKLKTTIPFFHDLGLRYREFSSAILHGDAQRIKKAKPLIQQMTGYAGIVTVFEEIKNNQAFRLRVTHHDTKISNVLFDEKEKGICVIDLDTVMPGYFISDVGDMLRTCLSPVSEEEKDFSAIRVREEFYTAIVQGYYREMKEQLTLEEKASFFYAGTFMTYMQALRFLADYLKGDKYYGAAYPDHNLVRAGNQAMLLQRLREKEKVLQQLL